MVIYGPFHNIRFVIQKSEKDGLLWKKTIYPLGDMEGTKSFVCPRGANLHGFYIKKGMRYENMRH